MGQPNTSATRQGRRGGRGHRRTRRGPNLNAGARGHGALGRWGRTRDLSGRDLSSRSLSGFGDGELGKTWADALRTRDTLRLIFSNDSSQTRVGGTSAVKERKTVLFYVVVNSE